jgi:hypothetical protein
MIMTDTAATAARHGDLAMAPAANPRGATAVHAAAIVLLTTAALLKAYQAVVAPAVAPLGSRLLEAALVQYELALAGLLALNLWPTAVWGLTTATFTVFAGVSVRKWLGGQSHCGCFGPVYVDPRITSVLDILMVALLMWVGPRPRRLTGIPLRVAAAVMAILMLGSAAAIAFAIAPKPGLVAAAGEYDFGKVSADQAARCDHVFLVHNRGHSPVRVTGYKSSCGCTVAEVPAGPIGPGASAEVKVKADWAGVAGTPYARITLHTDSWWTPRVPLVIHAEVEPAAAAGR